MNNCEAALKRLYNLSHRGICLGLDRVRKAAAKLGDLHKGFECVQIAGTNGKGSVSKIASHAISVSGLSTGLFTSPHLHRFTERFQINGKEVDPEILAPHLECVLDLLDENPDLGLTFFEVATLTAFSLFKDAKVDLAVLEVGLGGRLDATSTACPMVTAITSIGMDHMSYLGDSIEKIAAEKAAIARPHIPMVVGLLNPQAFAIVEKTASMIGAPVYALGRDFDVDRNLSLPLKGSHQQKNAAVAKKIFDLLKERYPCCTQEAFINSIASVKWPGRFEIIDTNPRYIFDAAHNTEAVLALSDTLREYSIDLDTIIFGALRDKRIREMLGLLRPHAKRIILVAPPISRAAAPREYAAGTDLIANDATEAVSLAQSSFGSTTVLVTGSIFIMAAVRAIVLKERTDPPIGL